MANRIQFLVRDGRDTPWVPRLRERDQLSDRLVVNAYDR